MAEKPDDYIELKGPAEIKKEELHPERMKRFVNHLSAAAIRAEERANKKQKVRDKIDTIKAVSLNKRSTKQMIENELGSFEDVVHEIIKDEEKILEEQRRETKQIGELKSMVENLSRKLIDIGREYARELEEKDEKIMELREALASANIKISESGEDRQKKIDDIERRIKQKQTAAPLPKTKEAHIVDVETHLKSLEERHKELKRMGVHSKQDLDRIQNIIDRHKRTLAKAKGIELPVPAVAAPKAVPVIKPVVVRPKPKAKPQPVPKKKPAKKAASKKADPKAKKK